MNEKQRNRIKTCKILSNTMQCGSGVMPHWTSETQINYMSQYDFITYDLEDDRADLIERPNSSNIVCVRYANMLGHTLVRIFYLYQDQGSYRIMVLPSFQNFNTNTDIEVWHQYLKVTEAFSFSYIPDSQTVVIPVCYNNGQWGIIVLNLTTSEKTPLSLQRDFPDELHSSHYSLQQFVQEINVLPCKQIHLFVIATINELILVKISTISKTLQILHHVHVEGPFLDTIYFGLSKGYVIGRGEEKMKCYAVDEDGMACVGQFDMGICERVEGMTGGQNRIVVWERDRPVIHQFLFNDITQKMEYINHANLESEKISRISYAILSESARNIIILGRQPHNSCREKRMLSKQKQHNPITHFFIFKLSLYTELNIHDNSLYVRNLKYTNRVKKVQKLVTPKIYECLYALTGSEIHTLDSHKFMGVLHFDIHPYGFLMAVGYSFNVKIYSLEHNSMTLLYNMSMHNIKKVLYSPNGAHLIMMSPKKLKIIDSFSFEVKYEEQEKSSYILNCCFSPTNENFYILLDGGVIIQKSFLDFEFAKIYRIFAHLQRKIVDFQVDEQNQNLYFLLQDGILINKSMTNLTAPEGVLEYHDGERISSFFIDDRNKLIFMGTETGKIRIHRLNFVKMIDYSESQINKGEITSIFVSPLQNNLYVGNCLGDITTLKFNSYQEESYHSVNLKLNQNQFSRLDLNENFQFLLLNGAKLSGNSQQNSLEDKLESLIQRIQNHTTKYRSSMINNYLTQEQIFNQEHQTNLKETFKEYETKCLKIKNDINSIKEKFIKIKKQEIEEYENRIKQIYNQNQVLVHELTKVASRNEMVMEKEKQRIQRENETLNFQMSDKINDYEHFIEGESVEKELLMEDQNFHFSEADALKFYDKALTAELSSVKAKCSQLNKNYGYLETAKKNMMSRKVQQETLEYRIKQELSTLTEINSQQTKRISNMGKELKFTEQVIHKIQNKVKNTPNNAISSDKADSDLCSYKIWMKEKVQEEVAKLSHYLHDIDERFEKKSQEMVDVTSEKKKNLQKIQDLTVRRQELKQKLKEVTDRATLMEIHNKEKEKQFFTTGKCQKMFDEKNFEEDKIKKIVSIERVNDKAIQFETKNMKIHTRRVNKLNSNCSDLLKQYEKLKYENKDLVDKQKKILSSREKVEEQILEQKKNNCFFKSERSSRCTLRETPFLTYVRIKGRKSKQNNPKMCSKTAVSTPRKMTWRSPRNSNMLLVEKNI